MNVKPMSKIKVPKWKYGFGGKQARDWRNTGSPSSMLKFKKPKKWY